LPICKLFYGEQPINSITLATSSAFGFNKKGKKEEEIAKNNMPTLQNNDGQCMN
jgi:hypothetical protein